MRLFSSHNSGRGFNRLTLVDSSRLFEIDFFFNFIFQHYVDLLSICFLLGYHGLMTQIAGINRLTWVD